MMRNPSQNKHIKVPLSEDLNKQNNCRFVPANIIGYLDLELSKIVIIVSWEDVMDNRQCSILIQQTENTTVLTLTYQSKQADQ